MKGILEAEVVFGVFLVSKTGTDCVKGILEVKVVLVVLLVSFTGTD